MPKTLVGCGGWAYFKVPDMPSLEAYARAFNFVEVNSTFYEIPSFKLVESWRKRVPEDFEFSVRCHHRLTHEYKFKPTPEATRIFEAMMRICKILNASILHFQTPANQKVDPEMVDNATSLLASTSKNGPRFAWEIRGPVDSDIEQHLLKFMEDNAVIHSVDISKGELPKVKSDVLYTRLFGKGPHNRYQFTDEEIANIVHEAKKEKYRESKIVGHGPKMYTDAARIKMHLEKGEFVPVTGKMGLESLASVLAEDARFPATKAQLISRQGWKVFDLYSDKRVRVGDFLQRLPERTFTDMDEIIEALR